MPCKWKCLWIAAKGENTWLIIAEMPLHVRGKHMISHPSHTGATHIHQCCGAAIEWKKGQNIGGFSDGNQHHNRICSSTAKEIYFINLIQNNLIFSLGLFARENIKPLSFTIESEICDWKAYLEIVSFNSPPAQAWSARIDFPGLYPGGLWISPRMETLWSTCSCASVWPLSWINI